MAGSFEDIRAILLEEGATLVGFADMTAIPVEERKGMPRALSIAVALDPGIVTRIAQGPTPEYFREYGRANAILSALAHRAEGLLKERGFEAAALEPTTEAFDAVRLRAGLSHKIAATRSGLGWIGKTDLLVSRRFGPRVRLASILTDLPLEPLDAPIDESRCGSCSLCVDICPAGAATGEPWNTGMHRDRFFDAFRCREYCRSISKQRLNRAISLCGKCVHICPGGRA